MADIKETEQKAEQEAQPAADNGKMSSKSSDISIEEIGAEEEPVEKEENAEVLLPNQEPEIEEIEPMRPELVEVAAKDASVSEDEDDEEDDDDFDDETLLERLVGLSEMFPEGLTKLVNASVSGLKSGAIWSYGATRSLTWIVCSSAAVMFLPIMIEMERVGMEEAQKQQQRQILLGPGAAMSGGNAQANAPLPKI